MSHKVIREVVNLGTPIPNIHKEKECQGSGQCIVRKMTEDEKRKYSAMDKNYVKPVIACRFEDINLDKGVDQMNRKLDFTKEELIELCLIHGTDKAAAREILKVLAGRARDLKQIQNCICNWGIKKAIAEMAPISAKPADTQIGEKNISIQQSDKDLNIQSEEQCETKETAKDTVKDTDTEKKPVLIEPRINYTNYMVGSVLVEIDFTEELIKIGDSKEMSYAEAAAACSLILETL